MFDVLASGSGGKAVVSGEIVAGVLVGGLGAVEPVVVGRVSMWARPVGSSRSWTRVTNIAARAPVSVSAASDRAI